MIRIPRCVVAAAVAVLLGLALCTATAQAAPGSADPILHRLFAHLCARTAVGIAHCDADVIVDPTGREVATAGPQPGSYGPADLRSAYALTTPGSSSQTIAVVDAHDDPEAEADLGVYRAQYGLPACTTADGCFRKVNQNGGTPPPAADGSWAQEISLDLDVASAICPNCHLLLVEARSALFADLGTAVNRAAILHATVISDSFGGTEYATETTTDTQSFNHPGIAITASTGDAGYGVEYPASSPFVTAVGGTTLIRANTARGWAETAWGGTGSGCSAYEAKPSWQTDAHCTRRTVADVSAVADPDTGVAGYDSYAYQGNVGWLVFGGTSIGPPLVAGVYALAGNAATVKAGSYPYAHRMQLFDVAAGTNGLCGGTYLCTSRAHYDGPTGLGTPDGRLAF